MFYNCSKVVDSKLVNCFSVPHVEEPPKFSLLLIGLDDPSIQGSETSYLAEAWFELGNKANKIEVKCLRV